jgi:hypothetical protein
VSENSCGCLTGLDQIRMAHEAGELEGLVLVAMSKDGKLTTLMHRMDVVKLLYVIEIISKDGIENVADET